jgi:sigma-B regulation protein RsbQ
MFAMMRRSAPAPLYSDQPTGWDNGIVSNDISLNVDVLRRNNVHVSGNPTGRTLVFAHGFGCSLETWRKITPAFLDDFQIVLFDHVGAGRSDLSAYDRGKYDSLDGYARDVIEIVEALELTDVVFVGHSVSAMIGVLAANARPDLVGSLVLVGPSPRYVDDGEYKGGFTQGDIEKMLEALDANYLGWSSTLAPVIMGNPDRPELGEELTASFCSIDPTIARHFARVTFLSDNRRDLADVTVPTLILQTHDDVIAPEHVGAFVAEHIAGSTLVTLPATGHIPTLSAADEVIKEIRSYLS